MGKNTDYAKMLMSLHNGRIPGVPAGNPASMTRTCKLDLSLEVQGDTVNH